MDAHGKPFTSLTSSEIDFIDLISSLIQSRQILPPQLIRSFKWSAAQVSMCWKFEIVYKLHRVQRIAENGCLVARVSCSCWQQVTTRPLRGSPPLGKAQGIINDLIFVIKPREDCQLKQGGGRVFEQLSFRTAPIRVHILRVALRQQYIFNVTFESNKRESGP